MYVIIYYDQFITRCILLQQIICWSCKNVNNMCENQLTTQISLINLKKNCEPI